MRNRTQSRLSTVYASLVLMSTIEVIQQMNIMEALGRSSMKQSERLRLLGLLASDNRLFDDAYVRTQ